MVRDRVPEKAMPIIKSSDFRLLAKVMRQYRLSAGITQKEVSGFCNVTQSTISRIEQGVRYPSLPVIRRIAEFLNIDHQELLIITALSALEKPGIKEKYLCDLIEEMRKDRSGE